MVRIKRGRGNKIDKINNEINWLCIIEGRYLFFFFFFLERCRELEDQNNEIIVRDYS